VAKAEAAAIAAVEAQLGEPLREDGPPLGVEFDPLPPGAFSTNGSLMQLYPIKFLFTHCRFFRLSLARLKDL